MGETKRVSESATVISHVVMPADASHSGFIHGGTIMRLVDEAAFVVATRHTRGNVVTVSLDQMSFLAPVRVGDILILKAALNYVGRTSMEVGVRVETERLKTGEMVKVGAAYLTMVSLGDDGKPTPAPALLPETDEDRRRHREGAERREVRLRAAGRGH
jgi:acyl-CoA hydrolase